MSSLIQHQTATTLPLNFPRRRQNVHFDDAVSDTRTSVTLEALYSQYAFSVRDYNKGAVSVSQPRRIFVFVTVPSSTHGEVLSGFEDYMVADWDGEGAQPVQEETLGACRTILADLPLRLQTPEVAPGADGSIGMEWVWTLNNMKTTIFIDVRPLTQAVVYYKLLDGERDERKFNVPDEDALRYIHAVFRRVESAISLD